MKRNPKNQFKRKKKPKRGPFSIACPQAGKMARHGYKPPITKWDTPEKRAAAFDSFYDQFLN